jgi:diguanylate cyclase (GGDEF)-like protein
MLDVDHFKNFNDTYGHEAGDHVLHEVGLILKQACRASDLACRYGGEEFVLLLLNADLKSTIERTAIIREELKKKHIIYGGLSLPAINVSMGVSMYPQHGSKPDELIRCADEALYKAKHDGRDRVEIAYTPRTK